MVVFLLAVYPRFSKEPSSFAALPRRAATSPLCRPLCAATIFQRKLYNPLFHFSYGCPDAPRAGALADANKDSRTRD